jgi:hypothetical protein
MGYRKHGLRALGLCLVAALGLIAFSAAAAQAAPPSWLVLANTTLVKTETISGKLHSPTALLKSVIGVTKTPILIHCSTLTVTDGLLFGTSSGAGVEGTALGILKFTNCLTLLEEGGVFVDSPNCKPAEPIEAAVKALLILHSTKTFILFEPDSGEVFTSIKFVAPCVLPESTNITGEVVAECVKAANLNEEEPCLSDIVSHVIQPLKVPTLVATNVLKFGKNEASLTGAAALELSGAHAGKVWGAHAD